MEKFFLSKDNSLLVNVDIQERLVPAMQVKDKVIGNTLHLIEAAKLLNIPLLVTEQYPKGLGRTIKEIADALSEYAPIEKITFSCCGERAFLDAVAAAGRTHVILIGMETHVCVLQTCLDLLRSGYHVHAAADAICSRSKENYRLALEFMRDAGAVISCTETILFQLLEKAGSDEFRAISKRIK